MAHKLYLNKAVKNKNKNKKPCYSYSFSVTPLLSSLQFLKTSTPLTFLPFPYRSVLSHIHFPLNSVTPSFQSLLVIPSSPLLPCAQDWIN